MHRIKDLHALPKVRDGWSYLYVEHCRIDREANAIVIHDEAGKVPVPFGAVKKVSGTMRTARAKHARPRTY